MMKKLIGDLLGVELSDAQSTDIPKMLNAVDVEWSKHKGVEADGKLSLIHI